jgi:amino acid transporter
MSSNQTPPIGPFAATYDRFITAMRNAGHAKRVQYASVSLVVAAVLLVFSSLSFLGLPTFVYVITAVPAAVLLFLNISALAYFTRTADSRMMSYKDNVPPRRRIRDVLIGVVVFIVALLVIGAAVNIPQGLGGSLVILVALLAYNIMRRTPEELRLAAAGVPDPREIRDAINEEDEDNS